MSTNVRKCCLPCYIDTFDVMYNCFISLLPPTVLDNLFGFCHLKGILIHPLFTLWHSQRYPLNLVNVE